MCPECGSHDIYIIGLDDDRGEVFECNECEETWYWTAAHD